MRGGQRRTHHALLSSQSCVHIDADCSVACTQKTTGPESESDCEANIAYEESPTQRFRGYRVPLAARIHGLWNGS